MSRQPRHSSTSTIALSELRGAGLYIINSVVSDILFDIRDDPEVFLGKTTIGQKPALRIDANAEDNFCHQLHKRKRGKFAQITVHGEERLNDNRDLNLTDKPGIYALVDMVDGTDLLERGLSNWCSAVVFFCPTAPEGKRILAAFVGIPSGEAGSEIYYATADDDGAYVKPPGRGQSVPVHGPSRVTRLQDASVCFYGQKATSLQSVLDHRLLDHVVQLDREQKRKQREKKTLGKELGPEDKDIGFRIYTLAGIPMMVKLADHRTKAARNIDVVLDVRGQQPHDVVAGAFIAKKAGVVLKNLNGKIIEYADLEERLLKPKDKNSALTYVLASTEQLCDETIELVKQYANPYGRFVARVVRSFDAANYSEKVEPALTRPNISEQNPNVLIFSPHPDDECITGGLALRLLRELNMNVINVAVTQGSNKERQHERHVELTHACNYLGFNLVQTQEGGLERITPAWRDQDSDNWTRSVQCIADLLRKYQPRVIFFPHSEDGHETHKGTGLLVQDALSKMDHDFSCYTVETEYWKPIDRPNLMIEISERDVVDFVTALSFHAGEVIRNPYHLRLPAWMIDNVRRGSELISGAGGRAQDFTFATIYKLRKWKDGSLIEVLDKGRFISISDDLGEIFN